MSKLPAQIGRYEIKSRIGRGGMGEVLLARDTNPNTSRLVAIKLLSLDVAFPDVCDRFAREARALATLSHPNIVGIFDSGEHAGAPYIVMEYVRGETLAEKIARRATMSLTQKLKAMVELCAGLAHAHEAGLIHRDIKPANLVVDPHGRLKILDFGIARVDQSELTMMASKRARRSLRIGTPGYMSPEQIEGLDVDPRSDIFAIGAVCHELLTYRQVFPGKDTTEVEAAVLTAQPANLVTLVPGLDLELQTIVSRALEKDRNKRYQDAATLEQAFERVRARLGWRDASGPASRAMPAAASSAGRGTPTARAEIAYERAVAAEDEGAHRAARRFAVEALAENPDHERARALLTRLEQSRPSPAGAAAAGAPASPAASGPAEPVAEAPPAPGGAERRLQAPIEPPDPSVSAGPTPSAGPAPAAAPVAWAQSPPGQVGPPAAQTGQPPWSGRSDGAAAGAPAPAAPGASPTPPVQSPPAALGPRPPAPSAPTVLVKAFDPTAPPPDRAVPAIVPPPAAADRRPPAAAAPQPPAVQPPKPPAPSAPTVLVKAFDPAAPPPGGPTPPRPAPSPPAQPASRAIQPADPWPSARPGASPPAPPHAPAKPLAAQTPARPPAPSAPTVLVKAFDPTAPPPAGSSSSKPASGAQRPVAPPSAPPPSAHRPPVVPAPRPQAAPLPPRPAGTSAPTAQVKAFTPGSREASSHGAPALSVFDGIPASALGGAAAPPPAGAAPAPVAGSPGPLPSGSWDSAPVPAPPTEYGPARSRPAGPTLGSRYRAMWLRHGRTLQAVALAVVGLLVIAAVAIGLSRWFWPSGYVLTVTRPQGGTVTGPGIECGTREADCSATLSKDQLVELQVTADSGYLFVGYTDDCAPSGRTTMSAAKTCGATFEKEEVVAGNTQTLNIVPPTGGTVLGVDIKCGTLGTDCTAALPNGVPVTLSAQADTGYSLANFTGDCTPAGETQMTGPKTCGAVFRPALPPGTPVTVAPPPSPRTPQVPSAPASSGVGGGMPSGGLMPGGGATVPIAPVQPSGGAAMPTLTQEAPVPPPISAEDQAKGEIARTLKAYTEAYKDRDATAVRRVFPGVPQAITQQLGDVKAIAACAFGTLEYAELNPEAGTAVIEAPWTLVQDMKVGGQKKVETIARVRMSRPAPRADWRIDSVTHRPK